MKHRSFRDRLWDRCTRRIPEGQIVPPWAIALRIVLYPVSTTAVLVQRHHPYDQTTKKEPPGRQPGGFQEPVDPSRW